MLRIRAWASHGANRGRDRRRCAIEHSAGSASEATSRHVKECASRADGRNLVHVDDDDRRTVHCPGRADDDREQRAVTGGLRRSAARPPSRMECCANRAAGYKLSETTRGRGLGADAAGSSGPHMTCSFRRHRLRCMSVLVGADCSSCRSGTCNRGEWLRATIWSARLRWSMSSCSMCSQKSKHCCEMVERCNGKSCTFAANRMRAPTHNARRRRHELRRLPRPCTTPIARSARFCENCVNERNN
jgi:hypothetical protein